MNRRAIATLVVMSLGVVSPGEAQTAASFVDSENGVSLDQAVARALAQEPSIRAARASIDVARGMRLQAGLRRNPSISAEIREEPSGTDNQTMVSVEWPLDLFRRAGRVAVADREWAATELSMADRERLLIADVRARFGEAPSLHIDEIPLERRRRALLDARTKQIVLTTSRFDKFVQNRELANSHQRLAEPGADVRDQESLAINDRELCRR